MTLCVDIYCYYIYVIIHVHIDVKMGKRRVPLDLFCQERVEGQFRDQINALQTQVSSACVSTFRWAKHLMRGGAARSRASGFER